MKMIPFARFALAVLVAASFSSTAAFGDESTTYAPDPVDWSGNESRVTGPDPNRLGSMAGVGAKPSKAELAKQQAQASGAAPAAARLSAGDRNFLLAAGEGAAKQVQLGKMAAQQAQSAEVKKLGSRMAAEHGKVFNELAAAAGRHGLKLSGRSSVEKVKDSANFDRAWLALAMNHQQKQLAIFQRQAQSGTDPELRRLAQRTVSVLQQHGKLAQTAQGSIGRTDTARAGARTRSGAGGNRR